MLFHLNLHIYDHHCVIINLLFTKSPRIFALVHDCQRTLPDLGQELLHVLPGEGGVDGVLVAGHQVRQGYALLELPRAVEQKIFRPNWVKNISQTCGAECGGVSLSSGSGSSSGQTSGLVSPLPQSRPLLYPCCLLCHHPKRKYIKSSS